MPKAGRIYKPKSVSFPPHLLDEALARARNLGLPFSRYIQKCIERDLQERGSLVFQEKNPDLALSAAEAPGAYRASPASRRRRKA